MDRDKSSRRKTQEKKRNRSRSGDDPSQLTRERVAPAPAWLRPSALVHAQITKSTSSTCQGIEYEILGPLTQFCSCSFPPDQINVFNSPTASITVIFERSAEKDKLFGDCAKFGTA